MPIIVGIPSGANTGVCAPWATPDDVRGGAGFDQTLLTDCIHAASDTLFFLSGRQYAGACVDTVRPCARQVVADHGRPFHQPSAGGWFSGPFMGASSPWGFCSCNRTERTGCNSVPEVTLGAYPVTGIIQVKVDGVVLPEYDGVTGVRNYRVDDSRWLVRMGDTHTPGAPNPGWMCCQREDLPDTEVGTWSVQFAYGLAPPTLGRLAAAELAYQFVIADDPTEGGNCVLPARVTNLVRQGETVAILDPMALIKDGYLGLPLCDRFLKSVNPNQVDRRAQVLSPDVGPRVRRTG